jgi:hypothetical protein
VLLKTHGELYVSTLLRKMAGANLGTEVAPATVKTLLPRPAAVTVGVVVSVREPGFAEPARFVGVILPF